jgi:DNA-binding NarL/FixJ family response regulator
MQLICLGKRLKMKEDIKVLLVDDHELIRQGLQGMLEPQEGIEVVGDYSSAEEALPQIRRLSPDIVLMDTHMPGVNGIEATRLLKGKELHCDVDVIMLAESAHYQAEALEAGAAAFLLKDVKSEELTQTIRQVYRNKHSLEEGPSLINEVELVIPPTADAARLLRFVCQLEETHKDSHSGIRQIVGSWDRGTVITIQLFNNPLVNFLDRLGNMPEVEKVEEEPLARGAFSSSLKKFGVLPRSSISPSKRISVTLKETGMARQGDS